MDHPHTDGCTRSLRKFCKEIWVSHESTSGNVSGPRFEIGESRRSAGQGMDFDTLGEIIATRRLYLIDEENVRRTVSVLVGKPQPSADSSVYFCPFQIIGIGSQRTHLANGNDSIQALQAAMILIATKLYRLNDEVGGCLKWNGDDASGFGFP